MLQVCDFLEELPEELWCCYWGNKSFPVKSSYATDQLWQDNRVHGKFTIGRRVCFSQSITLTLSSRTNETKQLRYFCTVEVNQNNH